MKLTKTLVQLFKVKKWEMDSDITSLDHEKDQNLNDCSLAKIVEIAIESRSAFNELGKTITTLLPELTIPNSDQRYSSDCKNFWLNTTQVANLLGISGRTLARYRKDNVIKYTVVNGLCRYKYKDVLDLLEKNQSIANSSINS